MKIILEYIFYALLLSAAVYCGLELSRIYIEGEVPGYWEMFLPCLLTLWLGLGAGEVLTEICSRLLRLSAPSIWSTLLELCCYLGCLTLLSVWVGSPSFKSVLTAWGVGADAVAPWCLALLAVLAAARIMGALLPPFPASLPVLLGKSWSRRRRAQH